MVVVVVLKVIVIVIAVTVLLNMAACYQLLLLLKYLTKTTQCLSVFSVESCSHGSFRNLRVGVNMAVMCGVKVQVCAARGESLYSQQVAADSGEDQTGDDHTGQHRENHTSSPHPIIALQHTNSHWSLS